MKNNKVKFTTKWITYTAVLTALVFATNFIPPIPTVAGSVYWVDGVILIASFLMDPIASFIIGGVGSFLYDLHWSPQMMGFSLVIHGLQGIIVSTLVHYVFPKKGEPLWAAIASVIAAVEAIIGYFLAQWVVRGLPVAITKFPRDIIQEIIGITIAMVICYATTFKRQLDRSHLLPDFKKEVLGDRKKKSVQTGELENTDTNK